MLPPPQRVVTQFKKFALAAQNRIFVCRTNISAETIENFGSKIDFRGCTWFGVAFFLCRILKRVLACSVGRFFCVFCLSLRDLLRILEISQESSGTIFSYFRPAMHPLCHLTLTFCTAKNFCRLKCFFIEKWYISKVGLGNFGTHNNLGDHIIKQDIPIPFIIIGFEATLKKFQLLVRIGLFKTLPIVPSTTNRGEILCHKALTFKI